MDHVSFCYGDESFPSLATAQAYIDTIRNPFSRFDAQQQIARQAFQHVYQIADDFESYMSYVEGDYARQDIFQSEDDFYAEFAAEFRFVREHAKERDRRDEARRRIERAWAEQPEALAWFHSLPADQQCSKSFLESLSSLADLVRNWNTARSLINFSVYERLANPGKGKRRRTQVMTADVHAAKRRKLAGNNSVEIPSAWLLENGMSLGARGVLEKSVQENALEINGVRGGEIPAGSPKVAEPLTGDTIPNAMAYYEQGLPVQQVHAAGSSKSNPVVKVEDVDSRAFTSINALNSSIANNLGIAADSDTVSESIRSCSDGSIYESNSDSDSDWSASSIKPGGRRRATPCGCSTDVDMDWMDRVRSNRARPTSTKEQELLLRDMISFRQVCYRHKRHLASILGLNVRIKQGLLLQRLRIVHQKWDRLDEMKTSDETFEWFCLAGRPVHTSDELSIYKFRAESPQHFTVDTEHLENVLEAILGCYNFSQEFLDRGTVNLPVFEWMVADEEINQIIDDEFDMYRYHLREKNGRPNYGWSRAQFYSLTQQLIRQDPVYWMLYCLLRPDHHWRLVSYPYYTKYAVLADGKSTYFRHIDLNIDRATADGHGTNLIQGSVSLDDEFPDGGTEMLLGLHSCFREWWADARARGVSCSSNAISRFGPEMFTSADQEKYGCRWTVCSCRKGEARITMPTIPHGANEMRTARRRTVLPWFVAVRDDLSTLEIAESGKWTDLAVAHTCQTSPPRTPSGFPNMFGKLPGRFPVGVQLDGLGGISDALVCHKAWDDPLVLAERDLLLRGDVAQVRQYVDNWRRNAAQTIKQRWLLVRQEEERAFKDRSFFKLRAEGWSLDDLWGMPPDM